MSDQNTPETGPAVSVEQTDGVVVLHFRDVSVLDDSSYRLLNDQIDALGASDTELKGLVVSMEGIKLVSTAIWGKLFVLNRKLQSSGGALAICGLGPLLRDAVRVLRLDRLLSVADTVADAVREVHY